MQSTLKIEGEFLYVRVEIIISGRWPRFMCVGGTF